MEPKSKTKSKSRPTKTSKKTTSKASVENLSASTPTIRSNSPINPKNKKFIVIAITIIILMVAAVLFYRNVFLAATVNGKPITRLQVINELEKNNGKATLDNLVTRNLIEQEAKAKGINPTQEEVDKELATITKNVESQGTTLDEALKAQGMTKNQLISDIKLQIMLRKLIGDSAKVSNKEVDDYMTQNPQTLPEGVTQEQYKAQTKIQLEQQKQQEVTEKLITSLREKAKIRTYINY